MKETKTIQVYPSDAIVNATIETYGSFGWEVIGNQRCQEYDRQTREEDGSLTSHYSTFNKITFTREKSSPWYDTVVSLEKEYNALQDTIDTYKAHKPDYLPPKKTTGGNVFLCIALYLMYVLPGLIYTIVLCRRTANYKKYVKTYNQETTNYNAIYPAKIKELESKQFELRTRAEKYVLGKA